MQVLARGYWPSYNVAFFPNIYDMAGEQVIGFGRLWP
jgi:hypothetical protein